MPLNESERNNNLCSLDIGDSFHKGTLPTKTISMVLLVGWFVGWLTFITGSQIDIHRYKG